MFHTSELNVLILRLSMVVKTRKEGVVFSKNLAQLEFGSVSVKIYLYIIIQYVIFWFVIPI